MYPCFTSTADMPNPECWGQAGRKTRSHKRGAGSAWAGEMSRLQRTEARGGQVAAKVGQAGERWGNCFDLQSTSQQAPCCGEGFSPHTELSAPVATRPPCSSTGLALES